MNRMNTLDWIAFILVIIGGIDWGVVGLMGVDFITLVLGTNVFSMIIFLLVGISAIYLLVRMLTKLNRA